MPRLMRCLFCGLLQDEPAGVKTCPRCGGELAFEVAPPPDPLGSYLEAQMELDQVSAPAGKAVDRYLLATLRTPKEVPPQHAADSGPSRPAIHLTAVIDVSGSMRGEKMQQVKAAMHQALRHLREGDWLSMVTFAQEAKRVLKPVRIDARVIERIDAAVQKLQAGGQTALCAGLELGLEQARARRCDTNLVLLLSDGQANVGETDLEAVGLRAYRGRKEGLIVSTLGVGMDYNEALMVEIATQGGGRYYHVQHASQIVPYLTGELGDAANLAARQTRLHLSLPEGAVLVPLTASYPVEQAGREAVVAIGDMACDLELELPLRVTLLGAKAGERQSVEGQVRYESPAGRALATNLNRVTVRFVEAKAFGVREGVVVPVTERVARHLHAAQVLEVSRAMAQSPAGGRSKAARSRDALREYAQKLDDEAAARILGELGEQYDAMLGSPSQAKMAVAASYRVSRSTKDY